jgi:hypothetical protein
MATIVIVIKKDIWEALEKFITTEVQCIISKKEDKKLSLISGTYVNRYSTLNCGDVKLRFEEGVGKFSASIDVGDVTVVNFAYIYPEYIAYVYLKPTLKPTNYASDNMRVIIVKEKEFANVRLSNLLTLSTTYGISLDQLFKKIKEIERRYLEELWPGQKIVYTAWVVHAMDKLGMLEEKEQKTA